MNLMREQHATEPVIYQTDDLQCRQSLNSQQAAKTYLFLYEAVFFVVNILLFILSV